MKPLVSIIMGSVSDWTVMEQCAKTLNEFEIPFEVNALSAHRTPDEVATFAKKAHKRSVKVIIAAAGMAAHLPGVIASMTPLPVIGVPIKATLEGWDAMLAILQMPPGIPVATVAVNGAQNSALLAVQILSVGNRKIFKRYELFKSNLKEKIVKANEDFAKIELPFKVN
jgi:5-(carboxyamino)imidazole ribonucleotide mutase